VSTDERLAELLAALAVADMETRRTLYEDNRDIWTQECSDVAYVRWAELNGGMPR
jgi:hypothetical protein